MLTPPPVQDDRFASSFISTIGIDFKIKTLELSGQRVRCQIVRARGRASQPALSRRPRCGAARAVSPSALCAVPPATRRLGRAQRNSCCWPCGVPLALTSSRRALTWTRPKLRCL